MTGLETIISADEYADRRASVLEALGGAAALVLAGQRPTEAAADSRRLVDSFFWYLTGVSTETGAAVLFDPSAEDPEQRITLFLRPRDPETERWDGLRDELDSTYRGKIGFATVLRTGALPARLTRAARRTKRLACLHPFAAYDSDISPDLALFKKVCERVPTVSIEDQTQLLPTMRAVKSKAELALIEKAVAITARGFDSAFDLVDPGMAEHRIAQAMTAAFVSEGGEAAYDPIVGAGANGTVLHYVDNSEVIKDGDLVVIDCAAAVGGYASDVTRTLPATGKFSPEQRELYEIVLQANLVAIEAIRPGATFTEIHQAARGVIAKAGHEDDFLHFIGHPIGIDYHEPFPDGPLSPGMVITVEPGVYLPDRGIGIRIEDDVLVTDSRARVLTDAIPKTVSGVEEALRKRSTDAGSNA